MKMSKQLSRSSRFLMFAACMLASLASHLRGQSDDFENEPINYSKAESEDPVAKLKEKLDRGELHWKWDEKFGYLPSLLESLSVPIESQVLVFSKTSLQIHKISPTNPRALYFNDSVYVGFVPGSRLLELAANDKNLGAVFYTLDSGEDESEPKLEKQSTENGTSTQEKSPHKPPHRIQRDKGQCLACHATSRTNYVPGYVVRSIYSDTSGRARTGTATYVTDYRSPLEHRWGGWYVTGSHGTMRHMGNVFATDREDPEELNRESGANRIELPKVVSASNYLGPHSDIVALMVLEHQARVHNLITRANFETRTAIYQDQSISRALDRTADYRSESTLRRIAKASQELVEALLYVEETPLESEIDGPSAFSESFSKRGPFTKSGKSLYQMALKTRLFRYPLSYLIYSPEFAGLPTPVLDAVRKELHSLLVEPVPAEAKIQLTADTRNAILEILRETKADLLME
jgi:hypothetical protein